MIPYNNWTLIPAYENKFTHLRAKFLWSNLAAAFLYLQPPLLADFLDFFYKTGKKCNQDLGPCHRDNLEVPLFQKNL